MNNLQRAGGISAIISAASYVFAIVLFATVMLPLADQNLPIRDYLDFVVPNKLLVFMWTFSMYLIHGVTLVVVVLAVHERVRLSSPRLSAVASAFGFIWTVFVLLSGFINIWGNEALIALWQKSPAQAEAFKISLTLITLGIDSSDRFVGSLWVGLASLAAFRGKSFPKAITLFGLGLGGVALVLGLIMPVNDSSASMLYGLGAIVWWLAIGIQMLREPAPRQKAG